MAAPLQRSSNIGPSVPRDRVIVIGENLVDLIEGEGTTLIASPGGGPFNVARTVARLGERCVFLSGISRDDYGQMIRDCLVDDGVELATPDALELASTRAFVDVTGPSATYRFDLAGTAAFSLDPVSTLDSWGSWEPVTRIVYVGTLGIVVEPMASAIAVLLEKLGDQVLLAFDPNCRPTAIGDVDAFRRRAQRIMERSDIVKVSLEDLEFLYPDEAPSSAAEEISRRGVACVIVTRGPRAVHVRLADGSFDVDVPKTEVVDTIGAGDALIGGLMAWWVRSGLDRRHLGDASLVTQAVTAAVEVAATTCQRQGAQPPRPVDLSRAGPWSATSP